MPLMKNTILDKKFILYKYSKIWSFLNPLNRSHKKPSIRPCLLYTSSLWSYNTTYLWTDGHSLERTRKLSNLVAISTDKSLHRSLVMFVDKYAIGKSQKT